MTAANEKGIGTGGTEFEWNEDISYPGVPFSSAHFNGKDECLTKDLKIYNYKNAEEVRNCRLEGLADLKQSKKYVKKVIAKYMNHLIYIGVAGFRIDAAKHMWPSDLHDIYKELTYLNLTYFPSCSKPFVFQEVIDMGEQKEAISASEYTDIAVVTNFIFGSKLANVFAGNDEAKHLKNWGTEWGMPKSEDVVVFIDNHDNQRGHGPGGWLNYNLHFIS